MFEIEKGIEPPKVLVDVTTRGRGRPPKYPFGVMEVGDSILVTGPIQKRRTAVQRAHKITANDKANGKKDVRHFATQLVGPNQTRIWRIA